MLNKRTRNRTKSEASLGVRIGNKLFSKRKSQVNLDELNELNKDKTEKEKEKENEDDKKKDKPAVPTMNIKQRNVSEATTIRQHLPQHKDSDTQSNTYSNSSSTHKDPPHLRSHSSFSFLDKLSARKRVISLPATSQDLHNLRSDAGSSAVPLLEEADDDKRARFRDRKKLRKSQETIHKVMARKADLLDYARRPPTSKQLFDASCCTVTSEDGTPVVFGSLYSTRRTIVILLRHAYCSMCQAYARTVSQLDRTLPLIFIMPTHHKIIESYRKTLKIPFPVYSDNSKSVYNTLGVRLRSANPGTVKDIGGYTHNLTSWESVAVAARLTPTQPGDTKQLGAEFVLGPGSSGVSYTHRMITTRGHAPIKDVIRACLAGSEASSHTTHSHHTPNQRGRLHVSARERVMSSPGAFNFPTPPTPSTARLPPGASHPSLPNLHEADSVYEQEQNSLVDISMQTVSTNTPSMLLGQTLPSPSASLAHLGHYISSGYISSGREPITPTFDRDEGAGEVQVVERPQRPPRNFSRPSSLWIKEDEGDEDADAPPVPPLQKSEDDGADEKKDKTHNANLPYPGIGTDTPRFLESGLRSPTPPALKSGAMEIAAPDEDFFEIYSSYDKMVYRDDSYTFEPSATFQSLRLAFERDVQRVKSEAELEKRELMEKREGVDEATDADADADNNSAVNGVLSDGMDEDAVREFEGVFDVASLHTLHNPHEDVAQKPSLKKRGSSILKRIENTARSQLHTVYPNNEFDSSFGVNRFNSIPLWRPRLR